MGILDALMKNPQMIGDVAKFAKDNPQIAKAAMGLLSSSGGKGGGLGSVLGALQSKGMGDAVSSWIGTGANKAISPDQLKSALGSDQIEQFAKQAGVSGKEASTTLAGLLPGLVDKLSPEGKLPDSQGLESMLGKLMGRG
jgi:uncharacterized protein YidB (DUF937 family)